MCRYVFHLLGLILLATTVGGCATPSTYNPFKVQREQLRNQIHTIALVPLSVSNSVMDPSLARERFEFSAIRLLEGSGISVVDSKIWSELWAEIGSDIGELYDASTGKVDSQRYEFVREEVLRVLRSRHNVDALLYLSIQTVHLYLTWAPELGFCGGRSPAYWPGGWVGDRNDQATIVVAACLNAMLYDMDDHQLYGIRSALEVIETYAHQTRAIRPVEIRFTDQQRNSEAVRIVIEPMSTNFRTPAASD